MIVNMMNSENSQIMNEDVNIDNFENNVSNFDKVNCEIDLNNEVEGEDLKRLEKFVNDVLFPSVMQSHCNCCFVTNDLNRILCSVYFIKDKKQVVIRITGFLINYSKKNIMLLYGLIVQCYRNNYSVELHGLYKLTQKIDKWLGKNLSESYGLKIINDKLSESYFVDTYDGKIDINKSVKNKRVFNICICDDKLVLKDFSKVYLYEKCKFSIDDVYNMLNNGVVDYITNQESFYLHFQTYNLYCYFYDTGIDVVVSNFLLSNSLSFEVLIFIVEKICYIHQSKVIINIKNLSDVNFEKFKAKLVNNDCNVELVGDLNVESKNKTNIDKLCIVVKKKKLIIKKFN